MSEDTKQILDIYERFLIQPRGSIDVKVRHAYKHARTTNPNDLVVQCKV